MAANATEVSQFIQQKLAETGYEYVTAVEAAVWLDRAKILKDSVDRPGLPLRNILRAGKSGKGAKIAGQRQEPNTRYGKWFIDRVGH